VQISLEVEQETDGLCVTQLPSQDCTGTQPCTYQLEWSYNAGPCGATEGEARFRVSGSGSLSGSTPAGTISIDFTALEAGEGDSGTTSLGLDCGGAAEGVISLMPDCDPRPNSEFRVEASALCSPCSN
jgi:hypothetical protein